MSWLGTWLSILLGAMGVAAALLFVVLPIVLIVLIVQGVRKRLPGKTSAAQPRIGERPAQGVNIPGVNRAGASRRGCPPREGAELRKMEKRLETARRQCAEALSTRIVSELARARIEPPLEDAYAQIRAEIDSIYAFCERANLVGTLKKARSSTSANDIYLAAYERDLAKVRAAIDKTRECLDAYERTVATLEVSSVEADISSDFDSSIEMLRQLRDELPRYNLEDHI